jgi:hypothetical protein
MRRLFWLALGATVGVLLVRKLSRAAEKLTPQGVAHSFAAGLNELSYALRDFITDVREAMTAQETALREAAGLDGGSVDSAGGGMVGRAGTPGPVGTPGPAGTPGSASTPGSAGTAGPAGVSGTAGHPAESD